MSEGRLGGFLDDNTAVVLNSLLFSILSLLRRLESSLRLDARFLGRYVEKQESFT